MVSTAELEQQIKQQEQKRINIEQQRLAYLEAQQEVIQLRDKADKLSEQVLSDTLRQRDRLKELCIKLIEYQEQAILSDKELVELEKRYLSKLLSA